MTIAIEDVEMKNCLPFVGVKKRNIDEIDSTPNDK